MLKNSIFGKGSCFEVPLGEKNAENQKDFNVNLLKWLNIFIHLLNVSTRENRVYLGEAEFQVREQKNNKRTFLATISSSFTMNSKQVVRQQRQHTKSLPWPVTETDLAVTVLLAPSLLIRSKLCLTQSSAVSLKQRDRKTLLSSIRGRQCQECTAGTSQWQAASLFTENEPKGEPC